MKQSDLPFQLVSSATNSMAKAQHVEALPRSSGEIVAPVSWNCSASTCSSALKCGEPLWSSLSGNVSHQHHLPRYSLGPLWNLSGSLLTPLTSLACLRSVRLYSGSVPHSCICRPLPPLYQHFLLGVPAHCFHNDNDPPSRAEWHL